MRAAMILLTMASLAAVAAPTRIVVVDIQKPEAPVSLTVLQGATANVAFELRQNGKPYTDLAEHSAEFAFATTLTNTPHRVDSTTTDEANGRFVFQLSDEDTAEAGRFAGILLITDAETNTFFQGRVDLSVLESAFATGAGELTTGETVNWDGTIYDNTATDGPYTAGTNVTFSAGSGGKVAINASITGGTGDVTGVTGSGGIVVVTSGTGPVPDVNVSTNAVRAAVSGIYLPLSGGTMSGAVNMGQANITNAGGLTLYDGSSFPTTGEISLESNILTWTYSSNARTIWHSGNDGVNSAVDAGYFAGQRPSYYLDAANATNTTAIAALSASALTTGTVPDTRLSSAARTIAFHAGMWEGPTVSQTPGWAPKSYAVAGLNAVVAGPVGSATQAAGTFASIFQVPSDATAWRTNKAISLSFIGDSTTSTAVKYRLRVYVAGNNTALHDVADQVLASTSTITTVDIAASSLGTCTADAVYTIVVDASVTTSGFYFVGQPRVQVIR